MLADYNKGRANIVFCTEIDEKTRAVPDHEVWDGGKSRSQGYLRLGFDRLQSRETGFSACSTRGAISYGKATGHVAPTQLIRPWIVGLTGVLSAM